jgi:hypothetical protein
LFGTTARPNQLGEPLAGHGEIIGQSKAGKNGHRLTARQCHCTAIIAAEIKATEQTQLQHGDRNPNRLAFPTRADVPTLAGADPALYHYRQGSACKLVVKNIAFGFPTRAR